MLSGFRNRGQIAASFVQDSTNNGRIYVIFSSDRFQQRPGFLIYYETSKFLYSVFLNIFFLVCSNLYTILLG